MAEWQPIETVDSPARIALTELVEYVALHAMDRLVEENGRIVGWEKSHSFRAMIERARAASALPAPPVVKEET